MPLACVAYGCTNHNLKENKPGFFRFPNDNEELRRKWVKACRRQNPDGSEWNPKGRNVYICGDHFFTGKPHRKDPNHPDYVPSIFTYNQVSSKQIENKMRRFDFVCRKRLGVESTSNLATTNNRAVALDNKKTNTALHGDISEHSAETSEEPVCHSVIVNRSLDQGSSLTEVPIPPVLHGDISEHSPETSEETVCHSVATDSLSNQGSSLTETHILPHPVAENLESNENSSLQVSTQLHRNETMASTSCTACTKSKIYERSLMMEIDNIRIERNAALQEVKELKSKFMGYNNLKHKKSEKFKYYTGITSETFDNIFKYLATSLPKKCRSKISFEDQLLMTLIKLRLDIQFENLADQFGLAKSTCHDIFKRWINLLYTKLKFLIKWPDHDASTKTLPHVFRQYFPRLTGIIDCTEFFIDRPKNVKARAQVYSNYKKHSTVKFLIACTPLGSISYVSKAWGGRVSDVELVKQSDFITNKYHHPGDQILADCGFTLADEFAAGCGVELIIPYFTKGKKQLSAREVEVTRQIASVRVHIEHVIGLLKNRYRILDGVLSTTFIKSLSDEANEAKVTGIDKLVTVCSALCNLGDGIVYKDENYTDNI